MYLELKELSFKYDQTSIIENFDLSADKGSITAIIGESGSGKSTLLRILAGLQNANHGVFRLDNQIIFIFLHIDFSVLYSWVVACECEIIISQELRN